MRRAATVCVLLAGCGRPLIPSGGDGDGESGASTDGGGTGSASATTFSTSTGSSSTTAEPPPPDTAGGDSMPPEDTADPDDPDPTDDGGDFIADPDTTHPWCNPFEDDCPRGLKCMPYATDGSGVWNATACFPVVEDPAGPDEDCVIIGEPTGGEDTCARGSMCWNTDPDTGQGYCVPFCSGSPSEPMCEDPRDYCTISGDGVLTICLDGCDPLAQDCREGEICVLPRGDQAACTRAIPDPAGAGEPCEFINSCAAGLACVNADIVPDCTGNGCCAPFCDLWADVPNAVCGSDDQECIPWFEPGGAPPWLEHLGICGIPTP